MLPILLALAAFHVPVGCSMTVPPAPFQGATGVYLAAPLPNGLMPQTGTIQLRPGICLYLDQSRGQTWADLESTTEALYVLAHELAHSYGIRNEDGATCIGARLVGFVARKIGATNERMIGAAYRLATARYSQPCQGWDSHGDPWTSTAVNDSSFEG